MSRQLATFAACICVAMMASAPSQAEPSARPNPAFAPKMLLQTGHAMAVTAAAWTPDSRFVVTGARDRQLLLWDTAGRVVDRAPLPMGWARSMEVQTIAIDPDGLGALAVAESEGVAWAKLTAYRWRFGRPAQAEPTLPRQGGSLASGSTGLLRLASPDGKLALVQLIRHGCWGSPNGQMSCGDRPTVLTIARADGSGARKVALVGQAGLPDTALAYLADYPMPGSLDSTGKRCDVAAADSISWNLAGGASYEFDSQVTAIPHSALFWAFAPDGRRAANVEDAALNPLNSPGVPCQSRRLRFFDFERGAYLEPLTLDPAFDQITWIGQQTLLATSSYMAVPALRIDVDSLRIAWSKTLLCAPIALDSAGTLVGSAPSDCNMSYPQPWCPRADPVTGSPLDCAPPTMLGPAHGLWLARPDGACRPLNTGAPAPFRLPCALIAGESVGPMGKPPSFSASSDGRLVTDGSRVWDVAGGRLLATFNRQLPIDKPGLPAGAGQTLLARDVWMLDSKVLNAWDLASGRKVRTFMATEGAGVVTSRPADVNLQAISPDGGVVAVQEPETDGRTQSFLISTGAPAGPAIELPTAAATFGFHPTKPLFWSQSRDGVISLHSRKTGAVLFTLYSLPGSHFFAVDPAGRYDTDLPPDSRDIRWLVPDAPLQSLAPQTFMRDFYEPGLMRKHLDCAGEETAPRCAQAFRPVPDLAKLNRVLPQIKGLIVRPAADGLTATVDVDVVEGQDPSAANHKTRSGVYDLRLFRDGKLVAQWPTPPSAVGGSSRHTGAAENDFNAWRGAAAVPGAQSGAIVRHSFDVSLPTDNGAKPVTFTAYAFNTDRVKGDNAGTVYTPSAAPAPRSPRAFVIAIGVNSYSHLRDHALSFSVDDAYAVVGALTTIPGYEVAPVALTADQGKASSALKADIRAVLGLLAGEESDSRAKLSAAGINASKLSRATPDDLVIISFSGHGWADARGNFYLLPSDAQLPDSASTASLSTLISSAELTDWLRGVDAGEMAIIIDACHSAASVNAAGFRPGPMGDPGLGQLSFDKGIRILAATQAKSVAMESAQLHGGLLTFALMHDGLGDAQRAPKADHDGSGAVRLDALLQYGLQAMPALAQSAQAGHRNLLATAAPTPMLVSRILLPPPSPIQQPSLFDFTGQPSRVSILPPASAR